MVTSNEKKVSLDLVKPDRRSCASDLPHPSTLFRPLPGGCLCQTRPFHGARCAWTVTARAEHHMNFMGPKTCKDDGGFPITGRGNRKRVLVPGTYSLHALGHGEVGSPESIRQNVEMG